MILTRTRTVAPAQAWARSQAKVAWASRCIHADRELARSMHCCTFRSMPAVCLSAKNSVCPQQRSIRAPLTPNRLWEVGVWAVTGEIIDSLFGGKVGRGGFYNAPEHQELLVVIAHSRGRM
jgi:hypothetical protein